MDAVGEGTWAEGEATLESGVDAAASMLERYDRVAGRWTLPKAGEFWDAVRLAHSLGQTGAGVRMAVIDGGFDPGIAALAASRRFGDDDPVTRAHGSVVALLVREVAPDAELLLYTVTRAGRVDLGLVADAITDAVGRGAAVINLSLGVKVSLAAVRRPGEASGRSVDWREDLDVPDHPVVRASAAAQASGVTVVAACGNRDDAVLLPAAHASAFAVGFLSLWRPDDGGMAEVSGIAPKGYTQSAYADFMLVQPPDVLGSSFATPQVAGFACLSPFRDSWRAYARSAAVGAWASDFLLAWSGGWDDRAEAIDAMFRQAMELLPHGHRQGSEVCPTCAVLALPVYLHWGLWRLNWGDLTVAEQLFRAVRSFAPGHAACAANLAITLARQADGVGVAGSGAAGSGVAGRGELLDEAVGLMAEAAAADPDDRDRASRLADFRAAVRDPGRSAIVW